MVRARVSIDRVKCTLCYRCVEFCPTKTFIVENGVLVTRDDKCIACYGCIKLCPVNAIDIKVTSYSVIEYVKYH